MKYAVSILICAVEMILMWWYFRKLDVFHCDMANEERDERPAPKAKRTQLYGVLGFIAILMIVATILTLQNVANYLNYLKLILLFGIISAAGVIDFKKTIIPNLLILVGLGIRGVIYIAEFFLCKETFVPQLTSDLIGLAVGFGFLLIVSLLTKGALGFGDVKLFGIIGLMSGAICTYSTLIFALLVSTLVSIVLLIMKKKGRKDSIPFGPCIMMGYFVALVLSSY